MTEAQHPVHARRRDRPGWRPWPRRPALFVALLVTLLVANALIGEQGFSSAFDTWRTYQRLTADVSTLRAENVRLRLETQRLRGDLATIEAVAREELGLILPGEKVFLLGDAPRSSGPVRRAGHR